jgi:hypothetical protein
LTGNRLTDLRDDQGCDGVSEAVTAENSPFGEPPEDTLARYVVLNLDVEWSDASSPLPTEWQHQMGDIRFFDYQPDADPSTCETVMRARGNGLWSGGISIPSEVRLTWGSIDDEPTVNIGGTFPATSSFMDAVLDAMDSPPEDPINGDIRYSVVDGERTFDIVVRDAAEVLYGEDDPKLFAPL